ncbi:MAG: hypothetical protein AAFQ43_00930 [Bacteroidota bacterium]
MRVLLFACVLVLAAPEALAQDIEPHDGEVTWRSYDARGIRSARVRVFPCEDERRPRTVVVDDRASNGRAPITDEAPYLAETIGRELGFDPTQATFVFRFTEAAFVEGGSDRGKALLVKATFRRTASGSLGAPSWHLLTPEALEDLTDRQMR